MTGCENFQLLRFHLICKYKQICFVRIKKSTIFALAKQKNGCVAQLNRVPHYGCGGYRFESYRGHH